MKRVYWWISFLALIISLVSLGFVLLRVGPMYELITESYVGIFISLLGICVALVLGYQIMNVIEWKDELTEIKIMKQELSRLKENLTLTECLVRAELCNVSANADYISGELDMALGEHLEALYLLLKVNDPKGDIDTCYSGIDNSLEILTKTDKTRWDNSQTLINGMRPIENVKKQIDNIRQDCCNLPIYKVYQKRFEKVVLSFTSWCDK